jgi:8-oxo-dGTP pyrophosphatase MutT (NUDIX family)
MLSQPPNPNAEGRLRNNSWYHVGSRETAIVFVHGIFSDSENCWTHQDKSGGPPVRWPDLIVGDPLFEDSSIFMGGFYTDVDSGDYGVEDASKDLFSALRNSIRDKGAPLDRQNILFICHSTGGIIVRHMLYHRHTVFSSKTVGLMLIASPSLGAWHARQLSWLSNFYRHKMVRQLRLESEFLLSLEDNFKDLLHEPPPRIPRLAGVELAEHHFLVKWKWFPPLRRVVEPHSAGRYFGAVRKIAGTNHSTIVKPDSPQHASHQALREFFSERFKPLTEQASKGLSVVRTTVRADPSPRRSGAGLRIAASVVVKGSHVLMVKRRDDGTWTFPSGIIKPGVDPAERARQNVVEETGVTCEVVSKIGERRHPKTRVHVVYFECRYERGEVDNVDLKEHVQAQWIRADEVFRYTSDIYPKVQRLLARTSRAKPEGRVAVAIVTNGDRVLMVRRAIPEGALEWHFPGGKIEGEEKEQEAIEREVYEETGISCKAAARLHEREHPGTGASVVYWSCAYVMGNAEVREPTRLDRVVWLSVPEALEAITSDLAEPVRDHLNELRNRAPRY